MVELLARSRIDASSAGLAISVELVVMALGSVFLARWLKSTPLLLVVIVGAAIILTGATLSLIVPSYRSLLAARVLTGMGEAAPLMVSSAVLARFPNPDRAFAVVSAITVVFGMTIFYSLPSFGTSLGLQPAFPVMLAALLLLTPLQFVLPRDLYVGKAAEPSETVSGNLGRLVTIAAIILIVLVPSGAMWSFSGVLGAKAGLHAEEANTAIAIAGIMSLPGTFAATWICGRCDRSWPIILGILILTIAVMLMANSHDPLRFRITACVNSATAYFLMPFFFGYAADEERSGKGGVIASCCFLMMNALGPYVGGLMFEHLSAASMARMVVGANMTACLLFLLLERQASSIKTDPQFS
jgi:predicted MFS family arabinose efflux permease